MIHAVNTYLKTARTIEILLVCFLIIGLLGTFDFLTGYDLSFSIFYLIPIALASWYTQRHYALTISIVPGCLATCLPDINIPAKGFSIGVAVFFRLPKDGDEAVGIADRLMYQVKKSSKNSVKYYEVADDAQPELVTDPLEHAPDA